MYKHIGDNSVGIVASASPPQQAAYASAPPLPPGAAAYGAPQLPPGATPYGAPVAGKQSSRVPYLFRTGLQSMPNIRLICALSLCFK